MRSIIRWSLRIVSALVVLTLLASMHALDPSHSMFIVFIVFLGQWTAFSFAVVIFGGSFFMHIGEGAAAKTKESVNHGSK